MDNRKGVNYPLLESSIENRTLFQNSDKCDKYDYLTAVGCGALGGLIDIFLVGSPQDTTIGKWTDEQVDKSVMIFAKHMGWNPREGQENNIKSAIGFLERNFKVNYDQSHSGNVGNLFPIFPRLHIK